MYRYEGRIKLKNQTEKQSFMANWRVGSTILQEQPGALGTHLHEVRDEPGSFFAVAEWESEEARDAMQSDAHANESDRAKRWNKLPKNESFGTVIAFFGSEIGVVLLAED